MKVLAGIDEVGLGPVLGPLVLGCAAVRFAEGDEKLYRRLAGIVTRNPGGLPHRLPIDDSKRMFAGRKSLAALELAALAALHPGARAHEGLESMVPSPRLPWPDWYARNRVASEPEREIPVALEAEVITRWRDDLPNKLASRGVELVECRVLPVLENELNEEHAAGRNKAQCELVRIAPILTALAERFPDDDLVVRVDRLGGRRYHAEFLHATFPFRPMRTLRESEEHSCYELKDGARRIEVSFEVEADGRHLPVALASMCAKYVRELFMNRLNAHFAARRPGLKPTAGYRGDCWRWLREVADVVAPREREVLVRQR